MAETARRSPTPRDLASCGDSADYIQQSTQTMSVTPAFYWLYSQ